MSFEAVKKFENEVARFFGAPYGVATDSCTHGIELCLRHLKSKTINVPTRTYISVPFLGEKLNIDWSWNKEEWKDYYYLTDEVIDAAVLWRKDSYIPRTYMNLSFQFQKHLSLGRGGMILTDNEQAYTRLKKMSYDGRKPDTPWREQNIDTVGYHYYMTPETALMGLEKLPSAIDAEPKQWLVDDWPDLSKMKVFQ